MTTELQKNNAQILTSLQLEEFENKGLLRISGIPVRVSELSGDAGDVVICHPWLLHTPAPNCGSRPRMMRIQRIHLVEK